MELEIMQEMAKWYLDSKFLDVIEKRITLDRFMGSVSSYFVIEFITIKEYRFLLNAAFEAMNEN